MRNLEVFLKKMPGLLAVISAGCSPIIKNILKNRSVNILNELTPGKNYGITTGPYFSSPLNGDSVIIGWSQDSTRIALSTAATNWTSNDTNGVDDVIVLDLVSGTVFPVSTNASGIFGDAASDGVDTRKPFSSDGKKVLFNSNASNLVSGDTNGTGDCFMKDLETGEVTRISTSNTGAQLNAGSRCFMFSTDDSKVFFLTFSSSWGVTADTNGKGDIIMKDLSSGDTIRVSTDSAGAEADSIGGYSTLYDLSPDGNYILFNSGSTNLVAGDTNGQTDLFMKDISSGTSVGAVTRISVDSGGAEDGSGSTQNGFFNSDGTQVIFQTMMVLDASDPGGFRDVYIRDLDASTTTLISTDESGTPVNGHTYGGVFIDATRVLLMGSAGLDPGDTNGTRDIMIKNLVDNSVQVLSLNPNGAFVTDADNLDPALSPDGSMLIYETLSSQVLEGDTNGAKDIVIYKIP